MPRKIQKEPTEEEIKKFESGAESSGGAPRFDLLPRTFLTRVAERFELGAVKYSDFNYRKGFTDEKFILDRINHLQEHLQSYLAPQDNDDWNDDNLAAIGWCVAFLMEVENDKDGFSLLNNIRKMRGQCK